MRLHNTNMSDLLQDFNVEADELDGEDGGDMQEMVDDLTSSIQASAAYTSTTPQSDNKRQRTGSMAAEGIGGKYGLGVRDPIRRADNIARVTQATEEYNYYGPSVGTLRRQIQRATMMQNAELVAELQQQLTRRLTDQVYKKLSPSYGVKKGIYGRGSYRMRRRRFRGRGSYDWMGGLQSFRTGATRFADQVARLNRSLAPGASAMATTMGRPDIASGINSASTTFNQLLQQFAGRGSVSATGAPIATPVMKANSLFKGYGQAIPRFQSLTDETGALVIKHTEYVKDITGNALNKVFTNYPVRVQPGDPNAFQYLSQIAGNFEEYQFVQLYYTYVPKITVPETSDGQIGSILMVTDYNADDPIKYSKQQILQTYGSSNGRIIDTIRHGIECDPAKLKGDGTKFIRTRGLVDSKEYDDYDHGQFQLVVSNTNDNLAGKSLGELWVSYVIVLRKPRVYTLYGLSNQNDQFVIDQTGSSASDLSNAATQKILVGAHNSINCEILTRAQSSQDSEAASLGNGQIMLRFPPSFSGTIDVMILKSGNAGLGSTAATFPLAETPQTMQLVGLTNTEVGTSEDDYWYDSGHSTTGDVRHFQLVRLRIEQAEHEGQNKLRLFTMHNGSADSVRCQIWIKRVNNNESLTSQPLVPYTKPSWAWY